MLLYGNPRYGNAMDGVSLELVINCEITNRSFLAVVDLRASIGALSLTHTKRIQLADGVSFDVPVVINIVLL
jgi:hypothetical protein